MDLTNRDGTAVDPVPFAIVVATSFAVSYSFGPVYLLTLGVSVQPALVASTAMFLALLASAYYRLIWTYRPAYREEVPVAARFRRLILTTAAALALLVLLVLPLFVR